MRCASYCVAASFEMNRLAQWIQTQGALQTFREVLHQQAKDERSTKSDIFYFSYGVVVFWGLLEEQERDILATIAEFGKQPLAKAEIDEFTFSYGDSMKIEEDEIILQNKSTLTKLSISYGIAQSVKLSTFEGVIQNTIDNSQHLPDDLAKKGKISLSRKEISKKMGELFIERNFINLRTEMLDTPEFFWEHPELEPFYRRTAHYLDVGKRVEVLNKRLNVVHELFEILSSELNHQHTARLEVTIIFLILIEILLVVVSDVFHFI